MFNRVYSSLFIALTISVIMCFASINNLCIAETKKAENGKFSAILEGKNNQGCCIKIENATPSGWNATVVGAGTKFFFQDENGNIIDEEIVKRELNLRTGDSADYCSSKSGCVSQTVTAIAVFMDGEEATFTAREQVGQTECLRHIPYVLAPKNISLRGLDKMKTLELRKKQ